MREHRCIRRSRGAGNAVAHEADSRLRGSDGVGKSACRARARHSREGANPVMRGGANARRRTNFMEGIKHVV